MDGFSFFCKVGELRSRLCAVAYRMGLAKSLSCGQITQEGADRRWKIAGDNIETFGLTMDDSPTYWAVLGADKEMLEAREKYEDQVEADVEKEIFDLSVID